MSYFIKKIFQEDNFTFSVEWNDGLQSSYRLNKLQKNCPCAGCAEQKAKVHDDVKAKRIVSVGRYALQIEFTSGCSSGIWDFDFLRKLAGVMV